MQTHVAHQRTDTRLRALLCLMLATTTLGCRTSDVQPSTASPTAPEEIRAYPATRRGLLDSLGTLATCADVQVPILETPPEMISLGLGMAPADRCAVVAAALRAAADHTPIPPWFDPSDVARVRAAGVGQMFFVDGWDAQRDPIDTVMQVELDIPGRPNLVVLHFDNVRHDVSLSIVHR